MRFRAVVASAVVAAGVLSGCAATAPAAEPAPGQVAATRTGEPAATPAATGAGDPAAAPAATPAEGAVDLAFTAPTLDGGTFDGASLAGAPALLWFWAPWCPTCAGQAAHVSDIAETYADTVTVIGVAGLDEEAAMRGFVEERGVGNVTHLADEAGTVWQRFGITAQSTFVLLDARGVVVASGYLEQAELDDELAALAG